MNTKAQPVNPARIRTDELRELYPSPRTLPLPGLYLAHDLRERARASTVYLYSNFLASIDGRVAVHDADQDELAVPDAVTNPRDWRLFLELAAPADALLVGGAFVRRIARGTAQALPPFSGDAPGDLLAMRRQLDLPTQPALVVLSRSLDLPLAVLSQLRLERRIVVITTESADVCAAGELAEAGMEIVKTGSDDVDATALVSVLAAREIRLVYSIAGPEILHSLLAAGFLDRLYLTTVLRAVGGVRHASLLQGRQLDTPTDFLLAALYLDDHGPGGVQQLMYVLDRVSDYG